MGDINSATEERQISSERAGNDDTLNSFAGSYLLHP